MSVKKDAVWLALIYGSGDHSPRSNAIERACRDGKFNEMRKELSSSSHKGVLSMEVRGAKWCLIIHSPLTGWD